MEMYNMIEFGPITYLNEVDWGFGNESPSLFDPVDFDAGSVVKLAKDVGFIRDRSLPRSTSGTQDHLIS